MKYRERVARPRSRRGHVLATLGQVVVFWSLFLGLAPAAIVHFERDVLGWRTVDLPLATPLAVLGFCAASSLGLWSAWHVATRGAGTPLPLDATARMVTTGPYGHIRNPMAVAGLSQGFFVALGFGSVLVALYVVAGLLLWQFLARPLEERDLERRFGDAFLRYRDAVPCWWPRRTPFRG